MSQGAGKQDTFALRTLIAGSAVQRRSALMTLAAATEGLGLALAVPLVERHTYR